MTTEEILQKLSEQIAEQGKQIAEVIHKQDEQGKQISELNKKVDNLVIKVDNLEKGQNELWDDVKAIKMNIENHVEPMLREISGRIVDSSRRIRMIENTAEAYEDDKEIDKVIAEIKHKGMM